MYTVESMTRGIRRTPHLYRDGKYRCFPRSQNRRPFAKVFASVDEAARFLMANAGWGIRMRQGHTIIYRGLVFVGPKGS